MKSSIFILSTGILISLISCSQPVENNIVKEVQKIRKENAVQTINDSIRFDHALQEALSIANQNIKQDKFVKKYNSNNISVAIRSDFYFSTRYPHLIIKLSDSNTIQFNIYLRNKNQFEHTVSYDQWALTYVSDTIEDINGDGLNDFIINWHSATGCCLKAFSEVYLLGQNEKTFSKRFEFINPTFSPEEKVVRGICYGHPGNTEMYKFKWVGESIDTLEYIAHEVNQEGIKTGKIEILANSSPGGDKKILKLVNEVPVEYQNINGYDWFTGEGYD